MKVSLCVASAFLTFVLLLLSPQGSRAEIESAPSLTGPFQYENLTVYFVHGPDAMDTANILTLDEAIERKEIRVHETEEVNELAVENLSKEKSIFIQAGDIVKGGKQDRTLSSDLLLKPRSGKVSIEAFCVEHGRWSGRGSEKADQFSSSKNRINSKGLKIAALSAKEQGQVWKAVEEVQNDMAQKLGKSVKAGASPSSLQLSLEDETLKASVSSYQDALQPLLRGATDATGYVFAINGELNSAEIYPSHELFSRLWPKMLNAASSEAFSLKGQSGSDKKVAMSDVRSFLAADKAPDAHKVEANGTMKKESDELLYLESREKSQWLHKSYLKK